MEQLTVAERAHRLRAVKEGLQSADAGLGQQAWHWGRHLKDARDLELWREDGAPDFWAWCEAELSMSRRSANRAIALCVHFTEEMAARFGSRRLSAVLNYIELTDRLEQPGDILALQIRFRGADGKFVSVPFPKATLRQIEDACKMLRASDAAKAEKEREAAITAEVRAQVEALTKLLPEAPAGTVRGHRVTTKVAKDGSATVNVQGLPLAWWAALLAEAKAD